VRGGGGEEKRVLWDDLFHGQNLRVRWGSKKTCAGHVISWKLKNKNKKKFLKISQILFRKNEFDLHHFRIPLTTLHAMWRFFFHFQVKRSLCEREAEILSQNSLLITFIINYSRFIFNCNSLCVHICHVLYLHLCVAFRCNPFSSYAHLLCSFSRYVSNFKHIFLITLISFI
jgi:hypothetical protein